MGKVVMFILLLSQLKAGAQFTESNNYPVKGQRVTVTDWGSRSLYILSDTYFAATKDSIIAQIGVKEFDEMEAKCSVAGWPEGFYIADQSDEEDKAFDQTLNKLKMYKIAAYTHIFNGKTFDRYVILRVPYEENKSWNPTLQWENNIYFMLKEKDVRPLN